MYPYKQLYLLSCVPIHTAASSIISMTFQGLRKHFTFGQAGFSEEGESVEKRANRVH